MYSQCPQCRAIFKVPEPHIGAHQGLVRCGHCNAVFHAVTNEVGGIQIPPVEGSSESPPETPPPSDDAVSTPDTERGKEWPWDAGPGEAPEEEAGPDPDAESETELIEPVLPKLRPGKVPSLDEIDDMAGLVTEEILIEAPPVLRDAFKDDDEEEIWRKAAEDEPDAAPGLDAPSTARDTGAVRELPASSGTARPGNAEAGTGRTKAQREAPQLVPPDNDMESETPGRTPRKSSYRGKDIKLVELPQPRPFKTASLSLLSVFLVLLLLWQAKTFLLDDLAQVPVLRPYLERICRPLGCNLPPRLSFAQIDLVGTSIDVNPEIPGALAITTSLANRAHFPQPYPLLRVTLTDREGRIVGRRTYLPAEYQQGDGHFLLPIKEARDVTINLAQPAENAVGYEVELVAPDQGSGG
jgi:predicted Zn finger-like uncharacterized protein